uniref:LON2 n=1 Tax=Arundo donax TaxID=35708 RepID=A0A0A9EDW1_ARUDO
MDCCNLLISISFFTNSRVNFKRLYTSNSSSTSWQSNLLAPEIAAPKSANLG